jgi:fibronectin-binding autotransporter adhesin
MRPAKKSLAVSRMATGLRKITFKKCGMTWCLAAALWIAGGGRLPAAALTWYGTANDNNNWDTNTSDANWHSTGGFVNFNNGDTVTFNNSGAGTPNVNIVGLVQPASIAVNPTAIVSYAFTNATGSIIGPGSLSVSGPVTLTIATTNSYSGGTTDNAPATLLISAASSLGTGMTTLMGGTLGASVNGLSLNADNLTVPSGTNGLINMTALMRLPNLYGAGALGINVNGTSAGSGSSTYGNSFAACVNFSGTLNITGAVSSAKMVLLFNSTGGGLSDGQLQNATVNLCNGVSLVGVDNSGGNTPQIGAINVDSTSSLGGSAFAGTLTYQIGALGTTSVIAGAVSGNGAIIKVGAGTLTLAGTNTYTGNTTVNGGVLALTGSTSLTNSPRLTLAAGAVLDVSGRTDGTLTLAAGQTLAGAGTINGSLVEGSTSVLNVSLGTLTVTNAATLNGTNALQLNRTNTITHSEIAAAGFSVGGTLIVTNLGPVLNTGDSFKLFNLPVGTFASVTLPVSGLDPGNNVITYIWTNRLAIDGTIQVLSGYVPPVTTSSTNAYLTGITLNPVVAFAPAFSSNVLSGYTATENYGSTFSVTVTNGNASATNQLTYQNSLLGTLTNGVSYGPLGLNPNPGITNVLSVLVTAQDGVTTNLYTVNVVQLPSQTPPHLTNSVAGGTNLVLNWPLASLGYRLLVQTNNLNKGVSGNTNDWMTVPNSTLTNSAAITILKTSSNEFYRLVYP